MAAEGSMTVVAAAVSGKHYVFVALKLFSHSKIITSIEKNVSGGGGVRARVSFLSEGNTGCWGVGWWSKGCRWHYQTPTPDTDTDGIEGGRRRGVPS